MNRTIKTAFFTTALAILALIQAYLYYVAYPAALATVVGAVAACAAVQAQIFMVTSMMGGVGAAIGPGHAELIAMPAICAWITRPARSSMNRSVRSAVRLPMMNGGTSLVSWSNATNRYEFEDSSSAE